MQRYWEAKENTKFIHDGEDVLVDDNGGTLTKYVNGEGIDNKLRQTPVQPPAISSQITSVRQTDWRTRSWQTRVANGI